MEETAKTVLCVSVPRERVEEVRKKLLKANALDRTLLMEKEKDANEKVIRVFLPLIFAPGEKEEAKELLRKVGVPVENRCGGSGSERGGGAGRNSIFLCERRFEKKKEKATTYKQLLSLPPEVVDRLPSSFDIIGDIAVIRIPGEAQQYAGEIGKALLRFSPHIKSVYMDLGVAGDYRIRKLVHLAGEKRTRTIHVEYGVKIVVDLARAYFSPRLATEHWRVATLVEEGERVLDMFTGVGPFALVIGKHRKPEVVYAVDINPQAIDLLRESISLNRIANVEPHVGDARKVSPGLGVDRVIMNLPHGAEEFFPAAVSALRGTGTVHLYTIIPEGTLEKKKSHLEEKYEKYGARVVFSRVVRPYAPHEVHAVFDIEIV